MTLVTTAGSGSMDRYGRALATRLSVDHVEVDLSTTTAGAFGAGARGTQELARVRRDVGLLRLLRGRGPLHLTSHHLGRYANLLAQPCVITAHDAIRLADARDATNHITRPGVRDTVWTELDYRGVRRAAAVIAPSAAAKAELVGRLGLRAARVFLVPHGVDLDVFRPDGRAPLDGPYVLFVGSEHPRKNLATLLYAIADLRRRAAMRDLRLVKVGTPGSSEAEFGAPARALIRALGLAGGVLLAGEVSDRELVGWYSGARCLAMPSRAEGFGLPVVEAMACGCPVVASTAGALPEVTGDAALLVAPDDRRALAGALGTFVADGAARREFRDRGIARARGFSWDATARGTMRVYEQVA